MNQPRCDSTRRDSALLKKRKCVNDDEVQAESSVQTISTSTVISTSQSGNRLLTLRSAAAPISAPSSSVSPPDYARISVQPHPKIPHASSIASGTRKMHRPSSVAITELGEFHSRQTCMACKLPQSQVGFSVCSVCDDLYHVHCLPVDFDVENENWICPVCVNDCALKTKFRGVIPPNPPSAYATRLTRTYSSSWVKDYSCSSLPLSSSPESEQKSALSLSTSSRSNPIHCNSWNVLLEPTRPLMTRDESLASAQGAPIELSRQSFFLSLSCLAAQISDLSTAAMKRAALKLPVYFSQSDEQRARARHQLATAMRDKQMSFDDEQSFPFLDCPPVRNMQNFQCGCGAIPVLYCIDLWPYSSMQQYARSHRPAITPQNLKTRCSILTR